MRHLVPAALVVLAACGSKAPPGPQAPPSPEELSATVAVQRAGCVRCHAAPTESAPRLALAAPRADLAAAAAWRRGDALATFLRRHGGGTEATAADLAAFVQSLAGELAAPAPTYVAIGAERRGEQLFRELACGACHTPAALAELPQRVDFVRLEQFLQQPQQRHPERAHPRLVADEAHALAAFLLRAQAVVDDGAPGFAWTCRELQIPSAGLPELAAVPIAASGVGERIDTSVRTRRQHYALEFTATLDVPRDGAWTFVTGSDDSSWLWLDGELLVQNEGLAPHRRAEATRQLTAGPHALRVAYTQAAGGDTLEVLWRGPEQPEEPLPTARASTRRQRYEPPPFAAAPAPAAVVRGRELARSLRCDACHTVDEATFAALPAPAPAAPWTALRGGPCPKVLGAEALFLAARDALLRPLTQDVALGVAMLRDGCLSCHVRNGRGGLPPAVKQGLREVEDLGDEGRLPPDLTAVGHRLRPAWIERVVAEGHAARPYVRVRMPAFGADKAREYAAWFQAVDARPGDAVDPAFAADAAEKGRALVGIAGKNCITCHPVGGHRALGPQGMDLLAQHERLQPEWFREWLLAPQKHRPGTRMPGFWPVVDDAARADVEAILAWSSLGAVAPLPDGLAASGGLRLDPRERPILHGAFLPGLSARCLCVGTAQRTHFAFELGGARLAWLWRGDFLDASGTWSGRAGQLLQPAGQDHVVLADLAIAAGDAKTTARELRGQRRTSDGYPVLQVQVGDADYEDEVRPRLVAGGSEIVRTLRCTRGALVVKVPSPADGVRATVAGAAANEHRLAAGQTLEIVYRWPSR